MRKKLRRLRDTEKSSKGEECCALCKCSDDDPALFGEKVKLEEHNFSVHYFCLLTSSGVYQRGEENEGVFGFLVDDIKQEVRRAARMTCYGCKKKGACIGCNVSSCRRVVHFPCGRKLMFITQYNKIFPSYCQDHSPTQSLCVDSDFSLPQSCSICLDSIEPVLSYSVLKCPSCHASWFHRDCVQHQAHSAGLFFFRCTLCNNKENFQQEMVRMGIYIPERDASWELEANAYSELLEVYNHCDSVTCVCNEGRTYSKKGWFEVIRCCLCGSRGTHRKCSNLKLDTTDWACIDCINATDGKASLVASPQSGQKRSLLSKRHLTPMPSPLDCKRPCTRVRPESPKELLRSLLPHSCPVSAQVEVHRDQALLAGLDLVRRTDFDPTHSLSVRFKGEQHLTLPSTHCAGDATRKYFLNLLMQQIQNSVVFEGPIGSKNLALDTQALREDLYFDIGSLLALCLVHGGPPIGFFSHGLYQCLFNYPANCPLSLNHMTPETHFTQQVHQIAAAKSLYELKKVMKANWEFLEVAGCNRPVTSLDEREALVEDLVSFTMITRMQLPLQRLRDGLRTLGVFDQVQLFPSVFFGVYCDAREAMTAEILGRLFAINFSEQQEMQNLETPIVSFWRHLLLECEVGRSSISLQDILCFVTGAEELPAVGLRPPPTISFLHHVKPEEQTENSVECWDDWLFPQSKPATNHLLLPVTSTYKVFKSSMEQAISHHVHLFPSGS
ncbi:G2/M phase-specific E3 ubiquitin-protein ligase isoform X1 [Xiphophorus couchianus]|uniref:G2/M phase-specific E3 ubiquitin-protein ligase isoform X1 n=1 Tax=Xiphophorus couchianus TaxID=32473 RepID=UPI00101626E0|nr:G2/M phase-specific E3 ubiquitin-protein ligase isoform X1 [Xiphophorus couchianus]